MKKALSILFSFIITLGCMCALAACSKPKKEQVNNMVIKNVWQSADGSVNLTVDVKDVEFNKSNGDERFYNVQPSIDGGLTWYNCAVSLEKSSVSGGEVSFTILSRNYYEGDYYFFGNQSDEYKVTLSTGNKLSISLRFAENNDYLASDKTAPVEYTVKSYTHLEMDGSSYEGGLTAGGATRYAFQREQDDSFKFIQLFVPDDEQGFNEVREVPAAVLSLVEYKFITKSDLEFGEVGAVYLGGTLRATENGTETSGWNDYDAQNGIIYEEYKDRIIHNVYTGNWTDGDGVVTGTYKNEYDVVYLIVRLKASGNALKSEVKLVTLTINKDEKDYDLNGNLKVD